MNYKSLCLFFLINCSACASEEKPLPKPETRIQESAVDVAPNVQKLLEDEAQNLQIISRLIEKIEREESR